MAARRGAIHSVLSASVGCNLGSLARRSAAAAGWIERRSPRREPASATRQYEHAAARGGHTTQVFGWQGVGAPRLSIAEARDLAITLEVREREMSAKQHRQNPADNAEPDDGVG